MNPAVEADGRAPPGTGADHRRSIAGVVDEDVLGGKEALAAGVECLATTVADPANRAVGPAAICGAVAVPQRTAPVPTGDEAVGRVPVARAAVRFVR